MKNLLLIFALVSIFSSAFSQDLYGGLTLGSRVNGVELSVLPEARSHGFGGGVSMGVKNPVTLIKPSLSTRFTGRLWGEVITPEDRRGFRWHLGAGLGAEISKLGRNFSAIARGGISYKHESVVFKATVQPEYEIGNRLQLFQANISILFKI